MGHIAAAAAAPARCSACATAAAAGQPPPQPSCLECPPVDPSAAAASISPSSAGGTEPGGPVAPPTPIAEPPSRVLAFGRVRVGPLGPGAAQSVPPDFGSAFAAPSPHQVKYSSPATTGSGVHPPAGADPALPASDGLPQPVTMTPGPVPSSSSSSPTAAIAAAAAAAAAAHVGGEVAPVPQVAVTEPPVFEGVGPRPLVATRDLAGRRVASPGTSSKPVITVRQTGFQVTSTPLPGATVSGSLLSSSPVGGRSPSPASGGLSSSPLTSFVQSGGFATNTGGPGSTGAPVRAHATPVFSPPLSPSTSPMSTAAIGTATMTVTTAATPASAIAGVAATTAPPTVIDAGLGKVASSSGPSVQPFPQADVGRPTSALTATIQAKSTRQDQPIRARRDSVINDILNQQWHRESDTGSGPSLSHATQS
ncbi:hypothetical protein, variant [Fonticula alba]|nr:hypothetical protein, variant [Fonticula alba]KCV68319.1 hypothetical protein, variant [Fonticula alba]|eukprot:XP_009497373.1 hypothetical protein, variant [Fonticula alba]